MGYTFPASHAFPARLQVHTRQIKGSALELSPVLRYQM